MLGSIIQVEPIIRVLTDDNQYLEFERALYPEMHINDIVNVSDHNIVFNQEETVNRKKAIIDLQNKLFKGGN